jgi:hypothetical protein
MLDAAGMNNSTDKIICPINGSTRYASACEANCPKRNRCGALARYHRPVLFDMPVKNPKAKKK